MMNFVNSKKLQKKSHQLIPNYLIGKSVQPVFRSHN